MKKDLFKTFLFRKIYKNKPFVLKQPAEVFLKNFTKLKGKHLYWSLFIKKEFPTKVFSVNFLKFSRTPFLQNTSQLILLFLIYLTVSFFREVLYICSNLLMLEKATKTHNFGIFSFCKYILYSILWMHRSIEYISIECIYYRSKHKHKKSCFVNARILESLHKKGKN